MLWSSDLGSKLERIPPTKSKEIVLTYIQRHIHRAIGMRRMLLIIDDAWNTQTALAFKLGGPHCAYLLTTRRRDVAIDFADGSTLNVPELSVQASLDLLGNVPFARRIVDFTGGLPLALALIKQQVLKVAAFGNADHLINCIDALADPQARLNLGRHNSPLHGSRMSHTSLAGTIASSVETLTPPARQALCALSTLLPKPNTFTTSQASALIDALNAGGVQLSLLSSHNSPKPARPLNPNCSSDNLYQLVEAGLVEPCGNGMYTIHRSIADYASTIANAA